MSMNEELSHYVAFAWQHRCSDLLLLAGSPPLVRFNGEMRPIPDEPVHDAVSIRALLGTMLNPTKLAEFELAGEVDFTTGWQSTARLRGNAYLQRGAPSIALRLIPDTIPTFDELGIPASVRRLAQLNQGLVLFTGPTGSGKSTSLAAIIGAINTHRACHILTIEDPIEYVHPSNRSAVSQREVGSDTQSFERALRAALREDPDVILVGEMRDPESIAITLTLAETGHLVLSTLHTNDSAQAIDRVVDVFEPARHAQVRTQLASTLQAIVAQRLVPRVGGGMTSAFEVLIATPAVRNLIRDGRTNQLRNNLTLGQADGMQTLEMSLNSLVAAGTITHDTAVVHALVAKDITAPVPAVAAPRR